MVCNYGPYYYSNNLPNMGTRHARVFLEQQTTLRNRGREQTPLDDARMACIAWTMACVAWMMLQRLEDLYEVHSEIPVPIESVPRRPASRRLLSHRSNASSAKVCNLPHKPPTSPQRRITCRRRENTNRKYTDAGCAYLPQILHYTKRNSCILSARTWHRIRRT